MPELQIDRDQILADPETRDGLKALVALLKTDGEPLHIGRDSGDSLTLPAAVTRILQQVAEAVLTGDPVSVSPDQELTTQEAADLLNISRQHFVRLLEAGECLYHQAGTHRRVYLADVLTYKRERDAQWKEGMEELAAISQEIGQYEIAGEPMPKRRKSSPVSLS